MDNDTPDMTRLVAPLVWEDVRTGYGPETYEAHASTGFYQVFTDEDSSAGAVCAEFATDQSQFGMTSARKIARVGSFPEAKAAAQADYAARIIAALDPAALAAMLAEAEQRGREAEREEIAVMISEIVTEAKRTNKSILGQYDLVDTTHYDINSGVNTPTTELTPEYFQNNSGSIQEESTQSKVKESKGKESKRTVFTNPNIKKEDSASAEKSADADKIFVSKKNKKQVSTRLFWQDFIDSWRGFYVQKFPGEEPIFEAQWMAKIYDRLLWRSEKIGKNWTKEYALSAMQFFLQKAHEDDWLRKHFSLKNLNEQLGAVFARAADKKKPVEKSAVPAKKEAVLNKTKSDLKKLISIV